MKKIILKPSKNRPHVCQIFIGSQVMEKISSIHPLTNFSQIFIITDQHVAPLFLDRLESALTTKPTVIILPAGEQTKQLESLQTIWKAMQLSHGDRKSLIINLGGGVIGDLGGLAASTYMRGVDFINIPTTLLAQVDASIGGKTGCNFADVKNLIGTFNQPRCVIIDTQTLLSLPQRELVAGFAEIIKHGLIQDEAYFNQVTSKPPLQFSSAEMVSIITRSCQIKAAIVEQDETENQLRKTLNFGHTIGHALESLSLKTRHSWLHGEAVSLGMLAEANMSHLTGRLSQKELERIKAGLKTAGLPMVAPRISIEAILEKIKSDKKNEAGLVNFTLLQGIGRAVFNQQVSEKIMIQAIQRITKGK